MPKLESKGGVKKINLSQIIETGNVREHYADIPELAASIKANSQLQPILVKAHGKNADGLDEYELVAGHRRIRAFKYLCDNGDDFSLIDALVVTGDKLTLQLIENLQRSDLTAVEREKGIFEMTQSGNVSQQSVAAMLGKNEQYIWRHINAYKARELAAKEGIDTSDINTGTLCEIASAAEGDIPLLIQRIKDEGGTLSAARRIGQEYRGAAPEAKPTREEEHQANDEADEMLEPPDIDMGDDDDFDIDDPDRSLMYPKEKSSKPPTTPHEKRETRTLEDFDPPHKQVDINDVLVIIKNYIERMENGDGSSEAYYKKEAAWDIVALLHEGL
jgi:ParB/RepB/Spo0J family partition protein